MQEIAFIRSVDFEELQPGDSLLTPRCTLTEADIGGILPAERDHFYAHMDKIGRGGVDFW
ncbi:hypothetical protein ACVXG7_27795 [Enterobacter hormaechei]